MLGQSQLLCYVVLTESIHQVIFADRGCLTGYIKVELTLCSRKDQGGSQITIMGHGKHTIWGTRDRRELKSKSRSPGLKPSKMYQEQGGWPQVECLLPGV